MTGVAPQGIDTHLPHSARVWDYWLGGKDNYAADREMGERIITVYPLIVYQAFMDRLFLGRVVRYLVREHGIRQFLDIGTGLPTADNTHEVAQRLAPEARTVYVDNDPTVLQHARALLVSGPEGKCDYIDADLREPTKILSGARATLDFAEPVAAMWIGSLHHVEDNDVARSSVSKVMDELTGGSFMVVNHATDAVWKDLSRQGVDRWNQYGKPTITLRSPDTIGRFAEGLEPLPPGVVSCSAWRPSPDDPVPSVRVFNVLAKWLAVQRPGFRWPDDPGRLPVDEFALVARKT